MSNDEPGETVPDNTSEMLDARAGATLAASARDKRQMSRLMFMASLLDEGPVVCGPDAVVVEGNLPVADVIHPAIAVRCIFPNCRAQQFLIGRVDTAVVVQIS